MAQEVKKEINLLNSLDEILMCITSKYHLRKKFNVGEVINREDVFLINTLRRVYCNSNIDSEKESKKLILRYGV